MDAGASTGAPSARPAGIAVDIAGELPAAGALPKPKARTRVKQPEIDLDERMRAARAEVARATQAIAKARSQVRNDKRIKQRLLKKAGGLSAQDLERIAVMKRCGLWSGAGGHPPLGTASASSSAGSAGSSSAAPSPAVAAASPTAVPDDAPAAILPPGSHSDDDVLPEPLPAGPNRIDEDDAM